MKTKLKSLVLIFLCAISIGICGEADQLTGNSKTSLGNYEIASSVEPLSIDGMTFETYQLNYQYAERLIIIGVESKRRCKNFIVKGPGFELEYVCKRGVFGARYINPVYRQLNENINNTVLDPKKIDTQHVISVSQKSEKELLALIACYLPLLIKDEFRDQI